MYRVTFFFMNRLPKRVARRLMFFNLWLAHFKVLDVVVVNRGSVIELTFSQKCEEFALDVRIIGRMTINVFCCVQMRAGFASFVEKW